MELVSEKSMLVPALRKSPASSCSLSMELPPLKDCVVPKKERKVHFENLPQEEEPNIFERFVSFLLEPPEKHYSDIYAF